MVMGVRMNGWTNGWMRFHLILKLNLKFLSDNNDVFFFLGSLRYSDNEAIVYILHRMAIKCIDYYFAEQLNFPWNENKKFFVSNETGHQCV